MAKKFSQLPNDFQKFEMQFKDTLQGTLSRVIRQEALNHFEMSWSKQGFTDQNLQLWPSRKPPERQFNKDGTRSKSFIKWQNQNTGRAILVGHRTKVSGIHLKDSLKGNIDNKRIIISTDKPYAQVHNEGGKAGRGKGFIMPQRQFMGPSRILDINIKTKFDNIMNKLFKQI
jgi:phage gpG-like protein